MVTACLLVKSQDGWASGQENGTNKILVLQEANGAGRAYVHFGMLSSAAALHKHLKMHGIISALLNGAHLDSSAKARHLEGIQTVTSPRPTTLAAGASLQGEDLPPRPEPLVSQLLHMCAGELWTS